MKCIRCGSDTAYAVRRSNGGRCQGCKQPLAFEPKTDPLKLTDGLFQKIISGVSADGTLYFTEKQLWYEFNRRAAKRRLASCGASSVLWIIALPALHALSGQHIMILLSCAAIALLGAAASKPTRKPSSPVYAPVSLASFRLDYLRKWINAHGEPDHLLPEPDSTLQNAPNSPVEDLTSFSFDRVVVTQHADTAAMLVANRFHFENNCAIVSLDGYPAGRFSTVFQMLQNNPNLMVFTIHDASFSGAETGITLRKSHWFPDPTIRIVDLGLRPIHAQKTNMILLKAEAPAQAAGTRSSLNADELAWLAAGNVAEIANVRPARLMRALYQGLARASTVPVDGTGYYDDSDMIWIYDPGVDVYAADSFG